VIKVHPTADVSPDAIIGNNSSIWHHAQVRENARIGENCIIGKGVYIDSGVHIGENVKIQNYVSVYHGVIIEDGVFVGPHVCFTNDLRPRAINSDGSPKTLEDWVLTKTLIKRGAALGANSTIRCGITIGKWAMIGAGSVIVQNVPNNGLVWGNPAWLKGFVCPCGARLKRMNLQDEVVVSRCPQCNQVILIPLEDWEKIR
jgi:UDP-2-acetamido-3-amino-2,3-dideoxy-glucuronate N-acetyltransferase